MANAMKKTLFYKFFPSKEEEIHAILMNRPYQVTQTLIEIRDDTPNPNTSFDPDNISSWRIRKRLDADSASTGMIFLTHSEVFEHIFRYSSMEATNDIICGKKGYVSIYDATDGNVHIQYGPYDDHQYFFKFQDGYVLALSTVLARIHKLKKDDEIGIYYDPTKRSFFFKVFR